MPKVKTGLDMLLAQRPDLVRGRRVGVVTNPSAVTKEFVHIIDALQGAGARIAALFAPEHGIRGEVSAGGAVPSSTDPRTGAPVYSLYGKVRKPTPEMLAGLEMVIFDVQDIGCRFYTYIYTMSFVMKACAESRKKFVVLDRPNPLGGIEVEGNIPEKEFASFVGLHQIPIRHGMTVGELAMYLNGELFFGVDLEVITCLGWRRILRFDETDLPWVMPSPNMPTLDTVALYPGTCLLEGTNVSEGRGTTRPFELVGAPWIDGCALAEVLNSRGLPGVHFRPAYFAPVTSKYAGEVCSGVQLHITDRKSLSPVSVGLHIISAVHELYGDRLEFIPAGETGKLFFDLLAGTDAIRRGIQGKRPVEEISRPWLPALSDFMRKRKPYLLYS
ncbi:MAG: exo-beta-N-acetylmuramidase NamZ family protein [Armatimonadota bacterium]